MAANYTVLNEIYIYTMIMFSAHLEQNSNKKIWFLRTYNTTKRQKRHNNVKLLTKFDSTWFAYWTANGKCCHRIVPYQWYSIDFNEWNWNFMASQESYGLNSTNTRIEVANWNGKQELIENSNSILRGNREMKIVNNAISKINNQLKWNLFLPKKKRNGNHFNVVSHLCTKEVLT